MAHCKGLARFSGMRAMGVPATEFGSYADRADGYRAKASNIRRMTHKVSQREARQSLPDVAETYDVPA
jgi:hypothetical protein